MILPLVILIASFFTGFAVLMAEDRLYAFAMGKDDMLNADHQKQMERLVGECLDLGRDPHAWTLHLICGLRELIGFQVGTSGMSTAPVTRMAPETLLGVVDHGWSDAAQRRTYLSYMKDGYLATDPTAVAFGRLPGKVVVRRREDVCPDGCWNRSFHYNELYRPAGLAHTMPCALLLPAHRGFRTKFINLLRSAADRPFSMHDRYLAERVLAGIYRQIGRGLMPFGGYKPLHITERERLILALLVRGLSDAQAAAGLGISPHTLRHHVKSLHRRFGVTSRLGLLAAYAHAIGLPAPVTHGLPRRERQVVEGLARGESEADIAHSLQISPWTVHDHVKNACRRLNVHSRGELLFFCRLRSNETNHNKWAGMRLS